MKVYELDVTHQEIRLLHESNAHESCVLSSQFLNLSETAAPLIISVDTKGYLLVWSFDPNSRTAPLKRLAQVKVHQSGINALAAHFDAKSELMTVLTGGDDNALVWTQFQVNFSNGTSLQVEFKGQSYFQAAHSSIITSVCFLGNNPLKFASTSIDQRLNLWELEDGGWKLKTSRFVDVADVSSLVIDSRYVLLNTRCTESLFTH